MISLKQLNKETIMGLDIYIETQPKNDLNNEASRKQVAYFRKFNALVGWMERNVGEVENCELLELTMNDICFLKAHLMHINESNCEEYLPTREGFSSAVRSTMKVTGMMWGS
ncbi:MAG: hypothetical protein [Bacteriophage sp.]|nr:MAG: hypothetical protein [Bacteriophage sp.]